MIRLLNRITLQLELFTVVMLDLYLRARRVTRRHQRIRLVVILHGLGLAGLRPRQVLLLNIIFGDLVALLGKIVLATARKSLPLRYLLQVRFVAQVVVVVIRVVIRVRRAHVAAHGVFVLGLGIL